VTVGWEEDNYLKKQRHWGKGRKRTEERRGERRVGRGRKFAEAVQEVGRNVEEKV